MAAFKHVQIRREGAVEHLELNRPEVRNAFNEDLIAELASWASHAAADAGLRAVVLRGAGPAFCAGADLVWMAKMAGYSQEDNIRDATVQQYIDEILGAGREAIAAAKTLLRRIPRSSADEATRLTIDAIAAQRVTPEAQQRMKDFLRKPKL